MCVYMFVGMCICAVCVRVCMCCVCVCVHVCCACVLCMCVVCVCVVCVCVYAYVLCVCTYVLYVYVHDFRKSFTYLYVCVCVYRFVSNVMHVCMPIHVYVIWMYTQYVCLSYLAPFLTYWSMQNNCTTSDRLKRFVFQRCRLLLVVNVTKKAHSVQVCDIVRLWNGRSMSNYFAYASISIM